MKLSPDLKSAALVAMIAFCPVAHAADPVDADSFINQGSSIDPSAASNTNAQLQMLMQQSQLQPATHQSTADQPADGPTAMWLLGVGNKTCKEWLDPKSTGLGWQGDQWALGYWTGLNTLNDGNHDVGKSLPPAQVIAAIHAKCPGHDDKTLQMAVSEAYVDTMKAGQ